MQSVSTEIETVKSSLLLQALAIQKNNMPTTAS